MRLDCPRRPLLSAALLFATFLIATVLTAPIATAEPLPSLSVGDAKWYEEARGTPDISVPVQLSSPSTTDVSFDFETVDGTAVSNQDYSAYDRFHPDGTVTISAGDTGATISLEIYQDDIAEGEEYFFVQISNPVGATIARPRGTATITDADQDPPTARIEWSTVQEGDSSNVPLAFTVLLDSRSAVERTVTVRTMDPPERPCCGDYATPGEDFDPVLVVVKFPPGVQSRTVYVLVRGDKKDERNEYIGLEIVFEYSDVYLNDCCGGFAWGIVYDDDPSPK